MESVMVLVTASVVSWITLQQMFAKKPPKSPEEQLGEALGKYLKQGIKVTMQTEGKKD